ncbi:MAG: hypothetical protein Q9179_007413 [Wetmoreana sp. 5 TL-2023]
MTEPSVMRPDLYPDRISYDEFDKYLALCYAHTPEKIQDLDRLRYTDIPELVTKRKQDGEAFLEKTEVQSLVDWKLRYGTYRPNLASLVASNSIGEIRKTTSSAFSVFSSSDEPNPSKAISTLSKLKGIGPATASLLLSCYDPTTIPFFSDELFRWLHWENDSDDKQKDSKKRMSSDKTSGRHRKINYTAKEYASVYEKTTTVRQRLSKESKKDVKAVDVEKAAYGLLKETEQFDTISAGDGGIPKSKRRRPNHNHKSSSPKPDESPETACLRKGPHGSPTYDHLGYELDYDFISKIPKRPRPVTQRGLKRLDKKGKDNERKAEIMGRPMNHVEMAAWDDRVARDLGKAFHEVGLEEYEEWKRRGFEVEEGDFENLSQEERDRLKELMNGSALRKGSKHR